MIGVVANLGNTEAGLPEIFQLLPQTGRSRQPMSALVSDSPHGSMPEELTMFLTVRGDISSELTEKLQSMASPLDPALRFDQFRTMQQIHEEHIVGDVAGGSALLAVMVVVVALSIAGIHTVMAFTVSQRRREAGIRAALGASPIQLVGGIFRSVSIPLGAGAALGAAVALFLEYYLADLRQMMVGGEGLPYILPITEAMLLLIALLALLSPVRRALRADPSEPLRVT